MIIETSQPSVNIEIIDIDEVLEALDKEIENDYYCLLED